MNAHLTMYVFDEPVRTATRLCRKRTTPTMDPEGQPTIPGSRRCTTRMDETRAPQGGEPGRPRRSHNSSAPRTKPSWISSTLAGCDRGAQEVRKPGRSLSSEDPSHGVVRALRLRGPPRRDDDQPRAVASTLGRPRPTPRLTELADAAGKDQPCLRRDGCHSAGRGRPAHRRRGRPAG